MRLLTKKPEVASSFHGLLREAVAVQRELQEMDAPANRKLSAEAFIREALRVARTTPEKVAALRRTIAEDQGTSLPGVWRFVRGAVKFIAEENCTRPPLEARRLSFLDTPDGAAQSEAATIGAAGLQGLFAIAAAIAAEKHPEAFGGRENWDEVESRREELAARRTTLLQRIEREYGAEDLTFDLAATPRDLLAKGFVRVGFKISGGEVTPGPGCGERLVSWLLAHGVEV